MDVLVMRRGLLLVLALVPALSVSGFAQAQALRDPTLPPASVLAPDSHDVTSGELRLEGIRRLPGKAPLAMINGQMLKVGDEIAGRRLVRIGESEVRLMNGQDRETLSLAPAVEKQMKSNRNARPAAPAKAGSGT